MPHAPRYKVIMSGEQIKKLQEWGTWARGAGILNEYLADLSTIVYRLSVEAGEWGRRTYPRREIEGHTRLGEGRMLNVRYNVCKTLVYVRIVRFRDAYPRQPPAQAG